MKKISCIIIFSLIISLFFSIIGFAENTDMDIIKIGLQYTEPEVNERKPLVLIKNDTSFEFGALVDNSYKSYFDLNVNQFYFDLDNNYHAAIGPFVSYSTASDYMTTHNLSNGFVVKNTAYYVFSGSFSDQTSAQNEVNRLNANHPAMLVMPNDQLVIMKNSKAFFGFDASTGDYIVTTTNSSMKNHYALFGDKKYRGGFGAKRINTQDVSIINYLYMNEYLYGVVPREMSKDWPLEALKAQAIVARNYAYTNMNKFINYGFNLDNSINSQVYGGYGYEGPVSNQAVDETNGLALLYKNALVSAYYHSNSGGFTENSENVWSAEVPYIKGRYDPFSLGAPNDTWTLNYSTVYIENKLKALGYDIGNLVEFYIAEYTDNNRVFNAVFSGTKDHVELSKQTIRAAFGYNDVKSTLLTVVPDNAVVVTNGSSFENVSPNGLEIITASGITEVGSEIVVYDGKSKKTLKTTATNYKIEGKGWGHGLGMSQWGAKAMAEQGFTFEEILTFYYTDTYIE